MNKKGIVVTLDSLVAFFIVLSIVSVIVGVLSNLSFSGQDHLAETAQQVLIVAEQTGLLSTSIGVNDISEFLNETLSPIHCGTLATYDEDGDVDNEDSKDGCVYNEEDQVFVYRTYIEDGQTYMASLRVWYDE